MTATLNQELPQAVDDFFVKDIPEPFQILGLRLLPLSIGRYRRMARHGIGFVSESGVRADGRDLLLGVLICSMTCKAWDALVISGSLPEIIASWMKQIHAAPPFYLRGKWGFFLGNTFLARRWRKNHSFDLLEKCRLFKAYVDEAQRTPRVIFKNRGDEISSSHWSHNIEVVLMGELNWRHEDIEERPLAKAIADYFKHAENQGMLAILTDADFEQAAKNDAVTKKALAELKAKEANLK